jgi:hypothetical protein
MSFFWRKVLKRPPPWERLCDEHDRKYERGGAMWERVVADWVLASGVWTSLRSDGHPLFWLWAAVMFAAVRVGGVWWLPFPTMVPHADGSWTLEWDRTRWGFGYRYPFYREDQSWPNLIYPRMVLCMVVLVLCHEFC